ncbi:MAG: MarR family winged helix-turn-helix transcriptional regulator [Desulfomonilia bacterium]
MNPDRIIYLIWRIRDKTSRVIVSELRKNSLGALAPSHGDILYALFFKGPLRMRELAAIIHRRKPTVTTLVNKLIQMDYVQKDTDPKDERVSIISLTRRGEDLKEILVRISGNLISHVYQGFSKEEKKTLIGLLEKLYVNL